MITRKMEKYYQKHYEFNGDNNQNQTDHIPDWAKYLIDLYKSPLKYKIKYEMAKTENSDSD